MKYLVACSLLFLSLFSSAYAEETPLENHEKEITKISEAFGYLMGKNLESIGVRFDIQYVIQGLKNASEGKESPMTELECIEAITAAQESSFKKEATENLSLAEKFLESNKTAEGIVSIEEGKVQYKVEKAGSGDPLLESSSPLIRYTGTFLNGKIFGSSTEDEPICLEEVIPGLKSALIGMQEGEKRTVYIHPDCAYGTKGSLPPNSLLKFEIEIIKSTQPLTEDSSPEAQTQKQICPEIAFPELPVEEIR
jgi:peptidylprolyl isomerase